MGIGTIFDKQKQDCLGRLDKSKKGSIDEGIEELVGLLNANQDYFTTSSCSGRILILQRTNHIKKDTGFVFVSHEKVRFSGVLRALKVVPSGALFLKQEGFILHVCCRNLQSGEKLLKLARDAGAKRSGIISLGKRITLEIIGTDAMEAIIAEKGKLLVSEDYLRILIDEGNKRMERNRKKVKLVTKAARLFL